MSENRKIEQWITVNGNHIPIFEGESKKQAVERFTARKSDVKNDIDIKNRQIEANKKEAENKSDTAVTKSERKQRDPHDLIPKDSYTHDAKYQASKKWLSDTADERNSIGTRWLEAYQNLEKARDKHIDPELVESLGRNQARMLVWDKEFPDTAEAKQIADKLMARKTELEDEAERHMNVLRRAKREHSEEQRQAYGRPEFKEAHGEYEGFKSNESTTPYVDEKLKEGKAHVVEMTPEQYIHECAHYIFKDSTVEGVLTGRLDTENLKRLTDKMRNGTKMDTPYINYERDGEQPGNQEGLHRAIAAYSLGIEKIPVIIIGKRRK